MKKEKSKTISFYVVIKSYKSSYLYLGFNTPQQVDCKKEHTTNLDRKKREQDYIT